MPKLPIYLDHHATTPVDPRVLDAMLPYFTEHFGNAASRSHAFGWRAEAAVEDARARVAGLLGADSPAEIVFTSGATESDNLAIKGLAAAAGPARRHVVTTEIEHRAVLGACRRIEQQGFRVTHVAPGPDGIVDPERVRAVLADDTLLVSVMLANNEVGSVQPIEAIGRLTRERGILLHCDATQGVGRVVFDVQRMNVDLASLSAHKIHGPKGCGALYVRRRNPRVRLVAELDGGGHERGMRSGTLNVPAIVGFAKACELLAAEGAAENERLARLRERLWRRLSELDGVLLNGPDFAHRLPGNLNVSFAGVDADAIIAGVRDVAVSTGSACTSATVEPSYVLRAMGLPVERARASIRFGIGRFNDEEQIDWAADRLIAKVRELRTPALDGAVDSAI